MTTAHSTTRELPRPPADSIARPRTSASTTKTFGPLERLGRSIITSTLGELRHGRVELWDDASGAAGPERSAGGAATAGKMACTEPALPTVTVRVHNPRFYSAVAFGGSVGAGDAYVDGLWSCDDLPGLIEIITTNAPAHAGLSGRLARLTRPLARLRYRLQRNSRKGARRNIAAHYDLGDEFFALFLDPSMTYSSGIFENGATTLAEAQHEKIDRACRALDLRPGEHLVEIGAGWGSLAVHAARHYGCRVTTTTISQRQHVAAVARAERAGMADRIRVLQADYRDLPRLLHSAEGPPADKLVSIEMVEAVGRERLGGFFAVCSRLLKPTGAALLQAIIIRDQVFQAAAREQDWLKKYIFPGSCLLSVDAVSDAVRRATDLRITHLDEFGPHYARTLALWRDSYLRRLSEARTMGFDERFLRAWDYYLAYCEGVFRARRCGVAQFLLAKPLSRLEPAQMRIAARSAMRP